MDQSTDALAIQALLTEFEALREGIRSRVGAQRQCLYFAWTVFGAIVSVALQQQNLIILVAIPLVLPFVYVSHREQSVAIDQLAHYIRLHLGPRTRAIAGDDSVMQFESFLVPRKQETDYHLYQVRMVFWVCPLVALLVSLLGVDFSHWSSYLLGILLLYLCALLVTAWQIVDSCRISRPQSRLPGRAPGDEQDRRSM